MAYIRDFATASDATDVTSHTVSMPIHQTDDILLVFVEKDANAGGDLAISGYTAIAHESADTNLRTAAFYKVATSSSESAPSVTSSDADAFVSMVISIDDANTSDVIEAYATAVQTSGTTTAYDAPSVTTATNDCLVFNLVGVDGNLIFPLPEDGGTNYITAIGNASSNAGASWFIQKTAGATATPTWQWSAGGRASFITVAINNVSGGKIPAYTSISSPPTTLLASTDRAISTTAINGYSYPTSLSLATIGSKSTTYVAAAGAAGTGLVAVMRSLNINTGAGTAYTTLYSQQLDFSAAKDLTAGLLGLAYTMQSPKDAFTGIPAVTTGSIVITVADTSNNYRAFEISGKDASPEPFGWNTALINCNQSTTDWAESGTAPTVSAITKILPSFNPKGYTGIGAYFAEFHLVGTMIVYGGNTEDPIGAEDLAGLGKGQRLKLIYQSGSSSLLALTKLQIGGSEKVVLGLTNSALQFPASWDTANRKVSFHGSASDLGISYYGVSGDTISHTNSVISSPSQWYWSIHSSATSSATWDFTGLTIVGAVVTLRDVMTFTSMSFVDCVSIDASSCDLVSCSIYGLTDNGDLTVNSTTTFDTCHFDTTDLAAGEYMTSTASPSIFTDCTFTGSSSTGHAIRITTAGTYTFTGNQFTGYGADGTTSAAIFNDSGGAVTINIAGGGSTPTYKNGTSATTTINNATSITVTTKKASDLTAISGVRVFIEADTGGPLPADESVTITRSSTTATVSHTAHGLTNGASVIIRGALQEEYNGVKTITYIDANSYSYTVSGTPATPATGTITSSAVLLNTTTDGSGVATNSAFSYTADQPIIGSARKASASPYYKSATIAGTVVSTGFSTTVLMIGDE